MTDFDTIWRTQDEIRTVVNAVIQVRLIEVMKACIYTWLNLNLKPFFFLTEILSYDVEC